MELPKSFQSYLSALLGEGSQAVVDAIGQEPVTSVRLNPFKTSGSLPEEPVPWASHAYYLRERPNFTFDPLFHAGCYYVQEASSMFLEQVVRQHVSSPVCALDLCAAPGGKSTHLRTVLPEGSLLVSNELIRNRANVLAENIIKWGHPDVAVTNNAPEDFSHLEGLFDVILTDVPCSGEGMFRKDETAIAEWSEQNVELCQRRSREIIDSCWPALKPGGLLIFSTCTFNIKENEQNVQHFCEKYGAEVLELKTSPDWKITGNLLSSAKPDDSFPVYRFLPGRTRGEGFFLSVLRKPADAPCDAVSLNEKKKKKEKRPAVPDTCKGWIQKAEDFLWDVEGDVIMANPLNHSDVITLLKKNLRVIHSGIVVASIVGNKVSPAQSLANSICLAPNAFPQVDVSYSDALTYLRHEAIRLPESVPNGFVLITFRGTPLGFAKNLGTRANNMYMSEWRIRTTHLPAEGFSLLS